MEFYPPLQAATLIKRYKRFLADVITPEGETLTLHCPNTGAMTGCATPGDRVWYSTSDNPQRKYPHTWELTETREQALICVNTLRANQLVKERLISAHPPAGLEGYSQCRSEVKYGSEGSRIDFLLQAEDKINCYIEVKSVTLCEQTKGFFPDAVSLRGQKHLRELINVVRQGERAGLLFAVLHSAITEVSPASHIDPTYGKLLAEAQQCGVEIIALKAELSTAGITLTTPLPVYLP